MNLENEIIKQKFTINKNWLNLENCNKVIENYNFLLKTQYDNYKKIMPLLTAGIQINNNFAINFDEIKTLILPILKFKNKKLPLYELDCNNLYFYGENEKIYKTLELHFYKENSKYPLIITLRIYPIIDF